MQVKSNIQQALVTSVKSAVDPPLDENKIVLAANVYDTIILTATTNNQYLYLPLLAKCMLGQTLEVTLNTVTAYIKQNEDEPNPPANTGGTYPFTGNSWLFNFDGVNTQTINNTGTPNYYKFVVSTVTYKNITYKVWRNIYNWKY
jgi:hypothetical protein